MTESDFEGKGRGRPATGQGRRVRVPPKLADRVQDFADASFTGWPDAVCQLIEKGLASAKED